MIVHTFRNLLMASVGAALLSSCATPQTQMAVPTKEAIETEAEVQKDLVRTGMTVLPKAGDLISTDPGTRIFAVGNRILIAGAPLCGPKKIRNTMPFGVRAESDGAYRILWAVESASGAGVPKPRDVVKALNGASISEGRAGSSVVSATMSLAEKNNQSLKVDIERDGKAMSLDVAPVKACDFFIQFSNSEEANAHGDGKNIVVYRGLMKLIGDDNELAFIIGHELTHNAFEHVPAGNRNRMIGALLGGVLDALADTGGGPNDLTYSKLGVQASSTFFDTKLEAEADYVGTYVMTLAGYDYQAAPDALRRLASLDPSQIQGFQWGSDHPATAERAAAAIATVAEIKRKIAEGQPLMPEMKASATKSSKKPAKAKGEK